MPKQKWKDNAPSDMLVSKKREKEQEI